MINHYYFTTTWTLITPFSCLDKSCFYKIWTGVHVIFLNVSLKNPTWSVDNTAFFITSFEERTLSELLDYITILTTCMVFTWQFCVFNFLWWVLRNLAELFTWIKFVTCLSFWRSEMLLSTFSLEKERNRSKLSLQWKGNPYVWTCNKTLFLKAYVANWWLHGSACPGVLAFAFDSLHILLSVCI